MVLNGKGKWNYVKISEVCDFKGGGTPSKQEKTYWNGNIPWASVKDIKGTYLESTEDNITDKGLANSSAALAKQGELILITRISPGKSTISKIDVAINQDLKIVKPKVKSHTKFLHYFFQSIQKQIIDLSSGTTVLGITLNSLNEIEIPQLSFDEQESVVSKIEELFSELDKGIENLKLAQQKLKVYRQAVLKWAFEGRLTNENVKEGELPEGYKWVKNKELLKYVTSGSRDWKQFYSNSGSRFVRTQDINTNKLDFENSAFVNLPENVEGKRSLIEYGDILMTITGANVGKVAVVDFPIKDAYVSQSVALLKYKDNRISKYIWYYFQAQGFGKSFIDKLVYGVGRPVLSLENMRDVDVLICPLEDQKLIIEALESKLSYCDKMEESINQSLQQAEVLRQSILKRAFEGKLH